MPPFVAPRSARRPRPLGLVAFATFTALTGCGGSTPQDPNHRELAWRYAPTQGGATHEHLTGTGTKGQGPLAKGWKIALRDQNRVTVAPHELAATHPLFGEVVLLVGLFDKAGEQLVRQRSPVLTAQQASFEFPVDANVAAALHDVVLWYTKP